MRFEAPLTDIEISANSWLAFLYFQPEDFWISSSKKGIAVFALPGEPGLAEVTGDLKIHFQDRHGDFYWFVYSPFFFQILELI